MKILHLLESNEEHKQRVLEKIENFHSFEDVKKFFNDFHYSSYSFYEHLLKEYPDIGPVLIDKIKELCNSDDAIAQFFKQGIPYYLNDADIDSLLEGPIRDFVKKYLSFENGKISFTHPDAEGWAMHPKVLQLIIKTEASAVEEFLKNELQKLPAITVKFAFDMPKFYYSGGQAIEITKDALRPLIQLAYVTRQLDHYLEDDVARNIFLNSQAHKTFSRGLKKEITKMLHLTEADVYDDDYKLMTSSNVLSDFFRALQDLVQLLPDAHDVGRDIFAWFYHLPRHGQVHKKKEDFLKAYQSVLGDRSFMNFVKLDFVLNTDEFLTNSRYIDCD